jgi:hypothetical protein
MWFLRGSVVSIEDPNGQAVRPVRTTKIACCPMAVRSVSGTQFARINKGQRVMEGRWGRTFEAWEMTSPGRPFRTSYGFNGWLFCCDFDASIPARTRWRDKLTGVQIDILRGRANIPVLLDSTRPYGHPKDYHLPPRREGSGFEIGHFCINRLNEHINSLFLDWSVRKVGLKELWTIKWHMQFNTAGPWTKAGGALPEDWPYWMRGLKDY